MKEYPFYLPVNMSKQMFYIPRPSRGTVTHPPKIKPPPRYLTLFEWPRVLCFDELFRQMTVAVLLPY